MTRRLRASLLVRLWQRVGPRNDNGCRLWTGARSTGGRRNVPYGCVRGGRRGTKLWRAHRLMLIFMTGHEDVRHDPTESPDDWLKRADDYYRHYDAAHTCDVSLCCEPSHLEWQDHAENIDAQKRRRRA